MTTDNSALPGLAPRPGRDGTLFRVRSPDAERIQLQLYESAASERPARTISVNDRDEHGVWSVFVPGVTHGRSYTWSRDDGPPLLDPFAVAVSGPSRFGCDDPERLALPRPTGPAVNSDARIKSLVVREPKPVAWNRPAHRREDLVIYELHVRGFTRGAGANVEFPGTYRGLAEKIPYLLDLGINAVEDESMEQFRRVMETNYLGAVRCIKAVLPAMRKQGSGCIVNITSIAGRVAFSSTSAYAASKFALEAFTESLAQGR